MLAYTMPIWSVFLAWPFLGERPNRMQAIALGLCALGLAVLIYPLAGNGIPLGIMLALATGVSWAAGTVYVKWARIKADPMGVASWQLTVAFVVLAACAFAVEGAFDLGGMHADGLAAIVLHRHARQRGCLCAVVHGGAAGPGGDRLARRPRQPGDRRGRFGVDPRRGPTVADIIGFALIFSSSACVLLGRAPPPVDVTP